MPPAPRSPLPYRDGLVFTAAEALTHGWSYAELGRAVRRGEILRVAEGAYVPRRAWDGWDVKARHLARARGKLATRGEEWALARRTAAVLHGIPLLGRLPAQPQLVRPSTGAERASSRVERVATLAPQDVVLVDSTRVTSLARTAVDVAREEPIRSALVVCDGALRAGAQPEELAEVLSRCGHWPGAAAAARVVALADGRAESALESVSRWACHQAGIPVFEPQVEVRCGARLVGRVDGLWREWGVVGEADGRSKYGSDEDLLAEKDRQDDIDDLGLVVVRWGWDDVHPSTRPFLAKVERARRRAEKRSLDPSLQLVSTTLAQAQARARRDRARARALAEAKARAMARA